MNNEHRYKGPQIGAYRKGRKACEDGVSIRDCPYQDTRQQSGKLTFGRSFRVSWQDGWNDRMHEILEQYKKEDAQ